MTTAVDTSKQEVRAQAKGVRASARKARLVADTIRNRSVPEARTILAFTQKAVARDFEKLLKSAVANAEANNGLEGDELVISAVYADEGPTLKRWKPRARGRAGRIFKRTCHITVKLTESAPVDHAGGSARRTQTEAVPATTETDAPAGGSAPAKSKRKKKEAVA
jgi:large subunit ribosomal protein L22